MNASSLRRSRHKSIGAGCAWTDGMLMEIQGYLEGAESLGTSANCDVRDVARAHVLAAEIPSASGRYIISEPAPVPDAKQASEWLQVCSMARA